MIKDKKKPLKKWGIDLVGRKMWYEPWPVDEHGNYKKPTEEEIENIYSISGKTANEILLYFEKCNGNTNKLIKMFNEHTIDLKFKITRKELLDKTDGTTMNTTSYIINRAFYNNENIWLSLEFVFGFEFSVILTDTQEILSEGAYYSGINKLKIAKLFLNIPKAILLSSLKKAIRKINTIYNYDFVHFKDRIVEIDIGRNKNIKIPHDKKITLSATRSSALVNLGAFKTICKILFDVPDTAEINSKMQLKYRYN